jgi:CubicO group peptidase (beta-lactamase class C family)
MPATQLPRNSLPRSTPAELGVAGSGVLAFLDAIAALPDIELHSLMVLRHGQVLAEGWWAPYGPSEIHLLYSLSKSFTSTALGLAVGEGRLSLDDSVLAHFSEFEADTTHPWSRGMTVRQLVAMATGHREDALERVRQLDPAEPVRGFLQVPPDQAPGTVFAYNNAATYVVGAIVQRLTGETLTDYLRPRLFEPLGIDQAYWDGDQTGRDLGFTGLHLTTEAVARFGQLYLDDGIWQGARLLPAGWVAEATALHTPNPGEPHPDWQQGYGYQFWQSRHGYRGDGAYGQFCLVLPEQDAVVVTTAATENMQGILDAVWAELLPAFHGPGSVADDQRLTARLTALALPVLDRAGQAGRAQDPGGSGGVPPGMDTAPGLEAHLEVVAVADDAGGGWALTVVEGGQRLVVRCGDQEWARTSVPVGDDRRLEVAASGLWVDPSTFSAELILVQTPHRLRVRLEPVSGRSAAQWVTGPPLRSPTLRGLATPFDLSRRG